MLPHSKGLEVDINPQELKTTKGGDLQQASQPKVNEVSLHLPFSKASVPPPEKDGGTLRVSN